ncbi:hypothetical protein CI610_03697 [invertebrate metagenome]|uniref:Uncharacterized protein n=1 Tax=invertebrate metagenome TaxID=1711999 RepID=A0A2H9T2D6_9ZZZZ
MHTCKKTSKHFGHEHMIRYRSIAFNKTKLLMMYVLHLQSQSKCRIVKQIDVELFLR